MKLKIKRIDLNNSEAIKTEIYLNDKLIFDYQVVNNEIEIDFDNKVLLTEGLRFDLKQYEKLKNFEWYVNAYLNTNIKDNHSKGVFHHIDLDMVLSYKSQLINRFYNSLPFEIKSGLLKFICDDLDIDFLNALKYSKYQTIKSYDYINKLNEICPKEFLNSIFE